MPNYETWKPAWWLEPARLALIVILPIFLAAAILGPYSFQYYRNFANNIAGYTLLAGVASILALCAGASVVNIWSSSSTRQAVIDSSRGTLALRILGVIAIIAYLIFLSPFVININLVLGLLTGNLNAMYEARETAERIPGITSFMQVGVVFCSVLAALRLESELSYAERRAVYICSFNFLRHMPHARLFRASCCDRIFCRVVSLSYCFSMAAVLAASLHAFMGNCCALHRFFIRRVFQKLAVL